jgi:hypothetical protein
MGTEYVFQLGFWGKITKGLITQEPMKLEKNKRTFGIYLNLEKNMNV